MQLTKAFHSRPVQHQDDAERIILAGIYTQPSRLMEAMNLGLTPGHFRQMQTRTIYAELAAQSHTAYARLKDRMRLLVRTIMRNWGGEIFQEISDLGPFVSDGRFQEAVQVVMRGR